MYSVVGVSWLFSFCLILSDTDISRKKSKILINKIKRKVNFLFYFPIIYTLIYLIFVFFNGYGDKCSFICLFNDYGFEGVGFVFLFILICCFIPMIVSLFAYVTFLRQLFKKKY